METMPVPGFYLPGCHQAGNVTDSVTGQQTPTWSVVSNRRFINIHDSNRIVKLAKYQHDENERSFPWMDHTLSSVARPSVQDRQKERN